VRWRTSPSVFGPFFFFLLREPGVRLSQQIDMKSFSIEWSLLVRTRDDKNIIEDRLTESVPVSIDHEPSSLSMESHRFSIKEDTIAIGFQTGFIEFIESAVIDKP
jgi:hypothetical protein